LLKNKRVPKIDQHNVILSNRLFGIRDLERTINGLAEMFGAKKKLDTTFRDFEIRGAK
jgi:hypothetical protein